MLISMNYVVSINEFLKNEYLEVAHGIINPYNLILNKPYSNQKNGAQKAPFF